MSARRATPNPRYDPVGPIRLPMTAAPL